MEAKRNNAGLWIALIWIVVSVLSMFFSVVSYTEVDGTKTVYAIQDFLGKDDFAYDVLGQYTGEVQWEIGTWALTALAVLAVCAILAALIGILILSKQRPVFWPYLMTVLGVIGTAIPALLILAATVISTSDFPGRILPGFYPIITPVCMILCLIIVGRERRRIRQAERKIRDNPLIQPAGDL